MNNCPSFCMCDYCSSTHVPNEPAPFSNAARRGNKYSAENIEICKLETLIKKQEQEIQKFKADREVLSDCMIEISSGKWTRDKMLVTARQALKSIGEISTD